MTFIINKHTHINLFLNFSVIFDHEKTSSDTTIINFPISFVLYISDTFVNKHELIIQPYQETVSISCSLARMPFSVEKRGRIAILRMNEGENRLNYNSVRSILQCLDEIESDPEFTAMISIGQDKHYSLGLDLDWIG